MLARGEAPPRAPGVEAPCSLSPHQKKRLHAVVESSGEFRGGNHQYLARTNSSGLAESRLKLGDKTGFHTVEATIKGNNRAKVEFRILSKA